MIVKYLNLAVFCVLLLPLSGCSGVVTYMENLQAQPVADLQKRSANFRPNYQIKQPKRDVVSPQVLRQLGKPPPPTGKVILDGKRYYSANGHVCEYFKSTDGKQTISAACYINGQWVSAPQIFSSEFIGR